MDLQLLDTLLVCLDTNSVSPFSIHQMSAESEIDEHQMWVDMSDIYRPSLKNKKAIPKLKWLKMQPFLLIPCLQVYQSVLRQHTTKINEWDVIKF